MKNTTKKYIALAMALTFCLVLAACSSGGESATTAANSDDSGSSVTENTVKSSTEGSTREERRLVFDKEILTDLFDDFVGGSKSSLVYDLEHDYFEYMQSVIALSGAEWDFYEARKYPQVAIDSPDADAFNMMMNRRAEVAGQAYDHIRDGDFELDDEFLNVMLDYVKEYEDYTVVESEKYLSIICGYCFKNDYWGGGEYYINVPEYVFDAFVFEKNSGRLLHNFDVVYLESASDTMVSTLEAFFDEINPGNGYYLGKMIESLWGMMAIMKMDDAFDPNLIKYEELYSNPLPAFYIGEDGDVRLLAGATSYGLLSADTLSKYRWYDDEVVDVSLSELPVASKQISELYEAVSDRYGIETDALALMAYIGTADDDTLAKFQAFVDEFDMDIPDDCTLIDKLSIGENHSPFRRSVYVVIPRYKYAKVFVKMNEMFSNDCVGTALVCVDQREDDRIPVLIQYFQEGEYLDELPYIYGMNGEKLDGYSNIYDITDFIKSPDFGAEDIREEIENLFMWIRSYG